ALVGRLDDAAVARLAFGQRALRAESSVTSFANASTQGSPSMSISSAEMLTSRSSPSLRRQRVRWS
ncbi:MAG: hypothetical protein Q7U32_08380, partial [Rhodocyclaceae bacterium]|nr:hypothetical protein [Rhodocyclaceae bacterium]